jgi:hypothetical protein
MSAIERYGSFAVSSEACTNRLDNIGSAVVRLGLFPGTAVGARLLR